MKLQIDNLTKIYPGNVVANKNISFSVNKGECIGIVGPNGSGKTTMVRQIIKILKPTSGTIMLDGDVNYIEKIAYVPQVSVIYGALNARENISLAMQYRGINKKRIKEKTDEIMELTGLKSIENRLGYTFSIGQKKLVGLACALGLDTDFLILDEPTSMVDILTKERVWQIISDIQEKTGVILASHDMDEIKQLCKNVVILKKGEMLFNGDVSEIGDQVCSCSLKVADKSVLFRYLNENNVKYREKKEDVIKIYQKDDKEMFFCLNEIKNKTNIIFETIEYPAFYDGVMSYVE